MIKVKNLLMVVLYVFTITLNSQNDLNALEVKRTFDIETLTINTNKTNCEVPINVEIKDVEKISNFTGETNIEKMNVTTNGGNYVINNFGVLKGNFYIPKKTEKKLRNKIETIIGEIEVIKNEYTILKKDLKDEIEEWKITFERFKEKIKKDSISEPKIKKLFDLLYKYKSNVETTICLSDDYINDVIIKTDKNGNRSYLFDLEKIKNDPNYFFVGEESGGFSVAKKFNKYGYLSHNKQEYSDIEFKYDACSPFSYGYATANDKYSHYVLNKSGKEILKYSQKIRSITILNENSFLIKGMANARFPYELIENMTVAINYLTYLPVDKTTQNNTHYTRSYIVDSIGKIKSGKYKSLRPIKDSKNYLIGNYEQLISKTDTTAEIDKVQHIVSSNGKVVQEIFLNKCPNNIGECISTRDCETEITQILSYPKTNYLILVNSIIEQGFTKKPSFITVKDYKNNKAIKCVDLRSVIKDSVSFYNIDSFLDQQYFDKNDFIIGINIYAKRYKSSRTINRRTKENKNTFIQYLDYKKPLKMIYRLSNNRIIGDSYKTIDGFLPNKKLLRVSKSIKEFSDDAVGFGIINYNGLYIVPPVFKEIKYIDNQFHVLDFTNIKYKVSISGKCIENCEVYNPIIRNYYTRKKHY